MLVSAFGAFGLETDRLTDRQAFCRGLRPDEATRRRGNHSSTCVTVSALLSELRSNIMLVCSCLDLSARHRRHNLMVNFPDAAGVLICSWHLLQREFVRVLWLWDLSTIRTAQINGNVIICELYLASSHELQRMCTCIPWCTKIYTSHQSMH